MPDATERAREWPIEPPAGTRIDDTLAWYSGQYAKARIALDALAAGLVDQTRAREQAEKALADWKAKYEARREQSPTDVEFYGR